ncbi:MAG: ABC transporter ATP-binding protein [Planctomycetes bacterium]|nr:ABC transporter ATP-binding protein [Planctomycetota bacterium]
MPVAALRAEPIIVCEHVSVAYGLQEVLHDVSLEIPGGAFVPFIGPNGAGKTTLLRAILGLLKPRRGRILAPFGRAPPGYVPQQKSIDPLYPVSLRQIVVMGLYPQLGWWRRPAGKQRAAVEAALERLGLADHAYKRYSELSGGMKQKVLVARALVNGPEVIVMDEPTSELDQASERDVLSHLLRLSREDGKTVLLAHHGLDAIAGTADRICLVDRGRVRVTSAKDLACPGARPRSGEPSGRAAGGNKP